MTTTRKSLLSTTEAAALVGVSKRTIHTWTRTGLLPCAYEGGHGPGDENHYRPIDVRNAEVAMRARRRRPIAGRS